MVHGNEHVSRGSGAFGPGRMQRRLQRGGRPQGACQTAIDSEAVEMTLFQRLMARIQNFRDWADEAEDECSGRDVWPPEGTRTMRQTLEYTQTEIIRLIREDAKRRFGPLDARQRLIQVEFED